MTTHVLILCTHNSARSVLSEGMLSHLAARLGLDVEAHSAGGAPSGRINPFARRRRRQAPRLRADPPGHRLPNAAVLALPLKSIDRTALQSALVEIGRS